MSYGANLEMGLWEYKNRNQLITSVYNNRTHIEVYASTVGNFINITALRLVCNVRKSYK